MRPLGVLTGASSLPVNGPAGNEVIDEEDCSAGGSGSADQCGSGDIPRAGAGSIGARGNCGSGKGRSGGDNSWRCQDEEAPERRFD